MESESDEVEAERFLVVLKKNVIFWFDGGRRWVVPFMFQEMISRLFFISGFGVVVGENEIVEGWVGAAVAGLAFRRRGGGETGLSRVFSLRFLDDVV